MKNRPDANSWSKVDFRHFRGRRLPGPIRVVGRMGCSRQECVVRTHLTIQKRTTSCAWVVTNDQEQRPLFCLASRHRKPGWPDSTDNPRFVPVDVEGPKRIEWREDAVVWEGGKHNVSTASTAHDPRGRLQNPHRHFKTPQRLEKSSVQMRKFCRGARISPAFTRFGAIWRIPGSAITTQLDG